MLHQTDFGLLWKSKSSIFADIRSLKFTVKIRMQQLRLCVCTTFTCGRVSTDFRVLILHITKILYSAAFFTQLHSMELDNFEVAYNIADIWHLEACVEGLECKVEIDFIWDFSCENEVLLLQDFSKGTIVISISRNGL